MTDQAQTLGKYQLQRHLATGGMAEIWLAEQAGPGGFNKELVIKRILAHFVSDDQFTTMFLDEARLAAQLSHPKIAQIYELGEVDGQYFIAMEYIQGIDLDLLLAKSVEDGQPIPIGIVCKIMMDVLEALDYAHDFTDRSGQPYNLVHRDVSPHNVLISNDGIVKLCDFGVAKAKANQTKTQPGAVKGKFAYMAPEQIQADPSVDRRADVFAAGIMFYELLTGVKPFGDELAAVNAIIAQEQVDPRTHRAEIPAPIVAIIERALQKKAADRYPDAHSMMREIEAFARTDAAFVGDRELSRYVRTRQGLPITRHSQPSVAVDETDESIEVPASGGEQKRGNTAEIVAEGGGADSHNSQGRSNTMASEAAPARKSHATLYVAFTVIVLCIVAALGFIAVSVVDPGDEVAKPPAEPKLEVVDKGPKANAALLKRPGGRPVIISTLPKSDIYVKGELVGSTPFDALLPPGSYEVEFRTPDGKKSRKETLQVKGTGFETLKFKL